MSARRASLVYRTPIARLAVALLAHLLDGAIGWMAAHLWRVCIGDTGKPPLSECFILSEHKGNIKRLVVTLMGDNRW
jgi:hypothetical protein